MQNSNNKQKKKNSQAFLDISVIVYDEENQYKLQKLMQMV